MVGHRVGAAKAALSEPARTAHASRESVTRPSWWFRLQPMPFTAMFRPTVYVGNADPGSNPLVSATVWLDGWIGGTWRVGKSLADGKLVRWWDQCLNMTDEARPINERLTEALMVAAEAHTVLAPVFEGFSPSAEMPEIAEAQAPLVAIDAGAHVRRE